jgi:xylulokinase
MGERTPIWDPEARGAFIGLTSRHTRAHLYRAVLEGVAFAFRQIIEISGDAGLQAIVAIDGGARSELWRSIFASVLDLPIRSGSEGAGTGLGSAFLAALGVGDFADLSAIQGWSATRDEVLPDSTARDRYVELSRVYAGLYPKLAPDFHALGAATP